MGEVVNRKQWEFDCRDELCVLQHDKNLVIGIEKCFIYQNDENGEMVYSIAVDDGCWMNAFKYKKDAVAFCKHMGWRVKR